MTTIDHAALLAALLDVAEESGLVMEWGAAPIRGQGLVFLWDCRGDADAAIMAAVASNCGFPVVAESIHPIAGGEAILGALLKATGDVEDAAMTVRTQYLYAMGLDPESLEPPF